MEDCKNKEGFQDFQEERFFALAFNNFYKFGPKKIELLLNFFGSLEKAYNANFNELKQAKISEDLIYDFLKFRKNFSILNNLKELEKNEIKFVYFKEETYPKILKEIYDPPVVLYYKGDINFDDRKSLAIIGSRKHSAYGEKVLEELFSSFEGSDLVIISGLARGIDSLAHKKALNNNLKTIAVLGSSLEKENIYPEENFKLGNEIINSGGALISEFPLKSPPLKQNFPLRNRIISGLSRAILVIEAKEKSGSLITVGQALDQGREIMAVPGNIFSEFSSGTNKLISLGAKSVKEGNDVLEFFFENNLVKSSRLLKEHLKAVLKNALKDGLNNKKSFGRKNAKKNNNSQKFENKFNKKIKLENKEENLVFSAVKEAYERAEDIDFEKIAKKTKLDTATINSKLSILELKSLIAKSYNGYILNEF